MNELKKVIEAILNANSQIDWLIVHKISKEISENDEIEFSFVDGSMNIHEPFNTNQGYISLKNHHDVKLFDTLVSQLYAKFYLDQKALSNLYIILTRVSYANEDETLTKNFINKIGKRDSQNVFNILLKSLNSEYYKHSHLKDKNPQNTNDWVHLFHSTQYFHSFSDPILSLLQLVRNDETRELDFELIEDMNPLLRSILLGWYGFDLIIKPKKLKSICENENELIFLSAYIVDNDGPNKILIRWLSQDLMNIFIEKYWNNIGKYVFVHAFGLSNKNRNANELYKSLENLIHNNLIRQIKSNRADTLKWIYTLSFPTDFIAMFSWFAIKKVAYEEISSENKNAILSQFIKELTRISRELPLYIASENKSNPFVSFQLHESKYINALAFILLIIIDVTSDDFDSLSSICHDFKPLFYGGFTANSLATEFSEVMLLIALSAYRIDGLNESMVANLNRYLETLSETILIPYIHLSERNNEIWNPESENQIFQFNAGKYLLNDAISNINKHPVLKYYKDFFDEFHKAKIAIWPFERVVQ